jgi:glycosyltransferase involved in cell wall biosynthesis
VKLSLIISAYNQREALDKIFRALEQQTVLPDQVVIADDGSSDGTGELIGEWKKKIRVPIEHLWQADRGFLKTTILNRAVAAVTGDYIVFLDGDCVPHLRFIADHRALAERGFWVQGRRCFVRERFVREFDPCSISVWQWALCGRIARPTKSVRLPFPIISRDRGQRGILGCNMAYWRDDVVAVNGFDESYQGRGMGADSDLGSRVYNLGRRRKFVYGRALVFHLDHPIMPRPHYEANKARLEEVLRSGRTRCEKGLDQYLKEAVAVV